MGSGQHKLWIVGVVVSGLLAMISLHQWMTLPDPALAGTQNNPGPDVPANPPNNPASASTKATLVRAGWPVVVPAPVINPVGESMADTVHRLTFGSQWREPVANAPELAAFASWTDRYLAAAPEARRALAEDGVTLAQARRMVFANLINAQPELAIAAAVPLAVRQKLPSEVVTLLEKRVSGRSSLGFRGVTAPADGTMAEPIQSIAQIDGQLYRAHLYGRRTKQLVKADVSLAGVALDGSLAVTESPVRVLDPGEIPVATAKVTTYCPVSGLQASPPEVAGQPLNTETPSAVEVAGGVYTMCSPAHIAELEKNLIAAEDATAALRSGSLTPLGLVESAPQAGSTDSLVPTTWTQGHKRLLVVPVDFPDLPGTPLINTTPITPDFILNAFNGPGGVKEFYAAGSYGKTILDLTAQDITPVLRLPQTAEAYATGGSADSNGLTDQLLSDAFAAALSRGYDRKQYDRAIVVFSNLSTSRYPGSKITYGGVGYFYYSQSGNTLTYDGYAGINGAFNLGTLTHELGHTFGLAHSNLWRTSDGTVAGNSGKTQEYGDQFTVMGSATNYNGFYLSGTDTIGAHFNPWHKNILGWLPDTSVQTVTTSGRYRLYRFDHQGASLGHALALKVARDSDRDYWIGYRQSFVTTPSLMNGAYVSWGYHHDRQSDLLDMNTPGDNNIGDAGLQIGQVYADASAGVTFRPVARGGVAPDEYLDVDISFGPTLDDAVEFASPNVTVDALSGNASVTINRRSGSQSLPLQIHYSTADGSAVASKDYTASAGTVSWSAGDGRPKTITIPLVASNPSPGAHTFSVQLDAPNANALVGPATNVTILSAGVSAVGSGSLDASFNPGVFNGQVNSVSLLPNGKMLAAGSFNSVGGVSRFGVARLEANGRLDSSFNLPTGLNGGVRATAVQPDGRLLIAGSFTTVGGLPRSNVARLNANGSLDTSFAPTGGTDKAIDALALLPDGRILVAGSFTTVNGVARHSLARLLPDGSLDSSFVPPGFQASGDGSVPNFLTTLAVQPDGKLLVGGYYQYAGAPGFAIARLLTNGDIDPAFQTSGANSNVSALALQPDGKIVVGGFFTYFGGTIHNRLVRLNPDGSSDSSFAPSIDPAIGVTSPYPRVQALLVQPDGGIVVAGEFATANGVARQRVARLGIFGDLDPNFNPGNTFSTTVGALSTQPDGNILCMGGNLTLNGNANQTFARLSGGTSLRAGSVAFEAGTINAAPGSSVVLVVSRAGGSDGDVSVNYATQDGSAAAGADYSGQAGTLTWVSGDTSSRLVTIPTAIEAVGTKTFSVNLGLPVGGIALGASASTQVLIGSKVPAITSATTADGQVGALFSYQIKVDHGDPSLVFGASGLPSGLSVNTGTGLISGTPAATGTAAVTLSATNAYGTSTAILTLRVAAAPLPVATLAATTASVVLNSGGTGIFTIRLSAAQDRDLTINYTVKGSAINGVDYALLKGKNKIKAGKISKAIKIVPQGDLEGASRKLVTMTLVSGDGYTVGTTAKVKIKIVH